MTQNKDLKDGLGRFRTLSLFREISLNNNEAYKPVYTLQEKEVDGLPSAYQIYMKHDTEYDVAVELLGSWQHWQRLLKCTPFVEYLKKWRAEKADQLYSIGVQCTIAAAKEGVYSACKWLTDRGWAVKSAKKKESNEDIPTELFNSVEAEIERISEHAKNG